MTGLTDLDRLLAALGAWFHPLTLVLVALDAPVPPVPSEVFVIGSGALAADGRVSLPLSVLTAWLGCWLGDVGLYALFRYRLAAVLDRWAWGRAVHRGIRRLLSKAGAATSMAGLFVLRFVSGGRTASMAAAGVARIRWRPFLWLSGTGSLTWSLYMVGLGWATGSATGLPWWASALAVVLLGTLLGAAVAAVLAWRRRGKERD